MLDAPERIHASPHSYAKHLAGYISDPSTIRARTLDMFGRAPSLEWTRETRAALEAARQRKVEFNSYLGPKWDGNRKIDATLPAKVEKPPRPSALLTFRPVPKTEEWRYNWRVLIVAVAQDFGFTYNDIVGRSKVKPVNDVRHLLMYLMWERCGSYVEAARRLGRVDHSSAKHSHKVFPDILVRSPAIAEAYRRYSIRRRK